METFNTLIATLMDPDTPYGIMDPVYAIYITYGLVLGLFRGLPEELAHLVGTILVAIGAHFLYQPVSTIMIEHTQLESEEASLALAYLLMVLLFFIVWRLIIFLIKKALDWTCPKPLYRPGGALLGAAKCILVLGVLLSLISLSGHTLLTDHLITRSWLGRSMEHVIPEKAHDYLPEWMPGRKEPPGDETAPPAPEASETGHDNGPGDA